MSKHVCTAGLVAALGLAGTHAADAAWKRVNIVPVEPGKVTPASINPGGYTTGSWFEKNAGISVMYFQSSGFFNTGSLCGSTVNTYVAAVNSNGDGSMVGKCVAKKGATTGFVLTSGINSVVDTVAVPGAKSTVATGLLTSGSGDITVVGTAMVGSGDPKAQGFTYDLASNAYQQVSPPNAARTEVNGISTQGTIFGAFVDSSNVAHGFLEQNGTFTVLDMAGYADVTPLAVNASNQVVGTVQDSSGYTHAFSWQNGTFTLLGAPNEQSSSANAITDGGLVAGSYVTTAATWYGFQWNPATANISAFNAPSGSTGLSIAAMNAYGQVTGVYNKGTNTHAFVATCTGAKCN